MLKLACAHQSFSLAAGLQSEFERACVRYGNERENGMGIHNWDFEPESFPLHVLHTYVYIYPYLFRQCELVPDFE